MDSKIKVGSPKSKGVVDESSQTLPQPATSSLDPRKRPKDPTASPEDPKTKKLEEEMPKASNKEEEWVEVLVEEKKKKKNIEDVGTGDAWASTLRSSVHKTCRRNELRFHPA